MTGNTGPATRAAFRRLTLGDTALIYGKLQASSRGEAVERAVELGLLESFPIVEAMRRTR